MTNEQLSDTLKEAWKEVFGVDEVSDDADFFAEGGDSIKAVQLSAWLIQKGIKLDLGVIFNTPVLSEMAEKLQETDPIYVPKELLTKEKVAELAKGKGSKPLSDQKVSDPDKTSPANQQICDPNKMSAANQQICDPNKMSPANQQFCDPNKMPAANQQICDPNKMQGVTKPSFGRGSEWNTILSMLQTMMSQQQVMLQMMQLMISRMMTPVPGPAMTGFPFKNIPEISANPVNYPELKKKFESYISRKVDAPIEKPNVIGIKPAKKGKAEYSAEEVLDHVLSGLLKDGYNKQDDLFAQGLTSLDTVKMVTRCNEHGYALSMKDIYMHSTYDELLDCMKSGE